MIYSKKILMFANNFFFYRNQYNLCGGFSRIFFNSGLKIMLSSRCIMTGLHIPKGRNVNEAHFKMKFGSLCLTRIGKNMHLYNEVQETPQTSKCVFFQPPITLKKHCFLGSKYLEKLTTFTKKMKKLVILKKKEIIKFLVYQKFPLLVKNL